MTGHLATFVSVFASIVLSRLLDWSVMADRSDPAALFGFMVGAINMCQALSRPGSRKSTVSPCASCDLARCNIEVNDRILRRAGRATAGREIVRYSRAFQPGRQHAATTAILAPHSAQHLPRCGPPVGRQLEVDEFRHALRASPAPDKHLHGAAQIARDNKVRSVSGSFEPNGNGRASESTRLPSARTQGRYPTYCQPDGRGSERSGRHAVGHRLRLLDAIVALCADALPMTTPSCATIRTDRDVRRRPLWISLSTRRIGTHAARQTWWHGTWIFGFDWRDRQVAYAKGADLAIHPSFCTDQLRSVVHIAHPAHASTTRHSGSLLLRLLGDHRLGGHQQTGD